MDRAHAMLKTIVNFVSLPIVQHESTDEFQRELRELRRGSRIVEQIEFLSRERIYLCLTSARRARLLITT